MLRGLNTFRTHCISNVVLLYRFIVTSSSLLLKTDIVFINDL